MHTYSNQIVKEKLLNALFNNAQCLDWYATFTVADQSFSELLRSVSDTLRKVYRIIASLSRIGIPDMGKLLMFVVNIMRQCYTAIVLFTILYK